MPITLPKNLRMPAIARGHSVASSTFSSTPSSNPRFNSKQLSRRHLVPGRARCKPGLALRGRAGLETPVTIGCMPFRA